MCVCVLLGSMCLKLQLRDDFERFIWCLDHWLCCMFDCIHVCVNVIWSSQGFTCVNVCSLNCLDLFFEI